MEVLVSSMNKDMSLLEKMNIQTNAVVINQTPNISENFSYKQQVINDRTWKFYSMSEKGVGRSRNNALMRASDDIIVMADEDEVFVDGYEKIINEAYSKYPDADMIIFNVRVHQGNKIRETTKKEGKVKFYNSLKYGTVTFTFKRNSILKKNLSFSLLFGGGTRYGSGEDTLFLWSALKTKLKIYSIPITISDVYNDTSSWFEGFNKKYYVDKGALYQALGGKLSFFLILQFWLRRYDSSNNVKRIEALKYMLQGAKNFKE
ncbi:MULTISPECIES: glycosyltransferase family 2 protein [Enterococcus]|uniref:glycosyltransferase family 2 protein n=1 Tax=Enterococcus TaxID=1350 RepID=UPI00088F8C21|nr:MULTISPECIES: glycosyltransferase [Enterococcus]EMF0480969.1 glycosyltransferase [Enterococcus faecium]MEB8410890.1 glycosyltransferase [Enterococcus faecium]WEL46381.1 glycosyltransferase [Enterococcus casseliflavus]SDJ87603.1 hypothetical protein SAMN05216513_101289 [Enterococcus casseliflavus]